MTYSPISRRGLLRGGLAGACSVAAHPLLSTMTFAAAPWDARLVVISGLVQGFGLGLVFVPLSGTMLTIAKLTPMYGYVSLARYPLLRGTGYDTNGNPIDEPLWQALLNVGVWTVIFAALCIHLVRRSSRRF